MRRYSQPDEERIRIKSLLREWKRSGLLESAQSAALEADLRVNLRRTNNFLRVVLFVFTALIVAASVALFVTAFDLENEHSIATVTFVAALLCVGMAEYLVSRFRFYRFGVEEAFVVGAVVLLSVASAIIASTVRSSRPGDFPILVGLIVGTLGAFGTYCRFGYTYAAVGSMICAVLTPFQMGLSPEMEHSLAAAMLTFIFVIVRPKRLQHGDEFPGDEYGIIQAAAFGGLYLDLNLQLTFSRIAGWFYWGTYATIWILPIIGLRMGLQHKDRALMDVSLAMALLTLVTNKPYLGLARQPWDPILFGLLLMAVAIILRRWMTNGPNGQRFGFTPERLFAADQRVLTLVGIGSAALQTDVPTASNVPSKPDFDGGRSGGAGASGSF